MISLLGGSKQSFAEAQMLEEEQKLRLLLVY
jgi:hypothetical protein